MTEPDTRRATAERTIRSLLDAVAFAEALEAAAHEPGKAVQTGDGTRLQGNGALTRLHDVRDEIGQVSMVALVLDVNRLATAAETLADMLMQINTPVIVKGPTPQPQPPPVVVSGCCRVPLGEAHAEQCQYADGKRR